MKATDLIKSARAYLDTPWHHCGRTKGVGVDCAGLLVGAVRDLGLPYQDLASYSRHPDGHTLIDQLKLNGLLEVPKDERQPGDIPVFYFFKYRPTHVGILTDIGLIHTHSDVGRVVEHRFNFEWLDNLHSVWKFPDIERI